MKKILAVIGLLFLMVACSSTEEVKSSGSREKIYRTSTNQTTVRNIGKFQVDSSTYISRGKEERIKFIILHYTALDNVGSIRELTGGVSAHFLVLDEDDNKIYSLVPLEQRAWHAGVSAFRGRTNINDTSVGIEIVNDGIAKEYRSDPNPYHPYDHYVDYKPIQIEKVAQIIKYVAEKYNIPARNIVAHSDIAPSRKKDPGAKFPWKELYDKYNIGAWYDEADKQEFMDEEKFKATSIREIKDELRKYGYEINRLDEWDKESKDVVYAFQLHFNPKNATGEMDLETFAILKALNKKYPD
ncbi:N-acetylmuramoyl-L-alanine amidase [Fusobacterium animalis]|uniref:N-acetylmuramoyl-L-alanine amidase n=1 Tax=Fusobacterium animalis TaxID=76859 RepID=UPI001C6E20F0|nr:N-acetylmuramoyl-L-alanine amidase [Fusobacterium animalis]QYR63785.1 N-acetylmuramoyl-L-alanine amidase [Fusobacterium animalis]BEO90257.1 N-acetylmuramoyl-L-alanine amidase [Fusobacterium nucleatum]BEP01228.1 N-acetylmuramoyl-L-alanine amidase [Fusobacterium nucleatum]